MTATATATTSIVRTFPSEKLGRDVSLIPVVEGQYPWNLGSQDCLRLVAVLKALGPQGFEAVVGHFAQGVQCTGSDLFAYGEYNGHNLLQLKYSPTDKRPLQFGASKAKALLGLYQSVGHSPFLAACVAVAGDAKPADSRGPAKGKGKAKPKGKPARTGGGKGRPAEAAEVLEAVEQVAQAQAQAPPARPATRAEIEAEVVRLFGRIGELQAQLRTLA